MRDQLRGGWCIVREWLAARCPILQRATVAKLFDGEKEISSLMLDPEQG